MTEVYISKINEADTKKDITRHVFNLSLTRNLAEMSIFFDWLRIKPTMPLSIDDVAGNNGDGCCRAEYNECQPIDGIAAVVCDNRTLQ